MIDNFTIVPPVRGVDKHGAGAYGASRGSRKHRGIDIACYAGSRLALISSGTITKIGYPYSPNDPKKGHLRYVQVTDDYGYDIRYLYCKLSIPLEIGVRVHSNQLILETQGLLDVYPGITDHFHFEVKDPSGKYINPKEYLNG